MYILGIAYIQIRQWNGFGKNKKFPLCFDDHGISCNAKPACYSFIEIEEIILQSEYHWLLGLKKEVGVFFRKETDCGIIELIRI